VQVGWVEERVEVKSDAFDVECVGLRNVPGPNDACWGDFDLMREIAAAFEISRAKIPCLRCGL
jgi:hypothetical protein